MVCRADTPPPPLPGQACRTSGRIRAKSVRSWQFGPKSKKDGRREPNLAPDFGRALLGFDQLGATSTELAPNSGRCGRSRTQRARARSARVRARRDRLPSALRLEIGAELVQIDSLREAYSRTAAPALPRPTAGPPSRLGFVSSGGVVVVVTMPKLALAHSERVSALAAWDSGHRS